MRVVPRRQSRRMPIIASSLSLFLFCVLTIPAWAVKTAKKQAKPKHLSKRARMLAKTRAEQPHWMEPLITQTGLLTQEVQVGGAFNTVLRNFYPGEHANGHYDASVSLILPHHLEVSAAPVTHLDANVWNTDQHMPRILLKDRLLAGNEKHGNYVVTATLGFASPVGWERNNEPGGIISPGIAAGKGWGKFDLQGDLSVHIPFGFRSDIRTPVTGDVVAQYHASRYFWPELELNSSWNSYPVTSVNSMQLVTGGLMMGPFHLWRETRLSFGAGYQTSLSRAPAPYVKNLVFKAIFHF